MTRAPMVLVAPLRAERLDAGAIAFAFGVAGYAGTPLNPVFPPDACIGLSRAADLMRRGRSSVRILVATDLSPALVRTMAAILADDDDADEAALPLDDAAGPPVVRAPLPREWGRAWTPMAMQKAVHDLMDAVGAWEDRAAAG